MLEHPILASGLIMNAYAASDFFGKLIFIALFALSGVTWYVLLQKTFLFRNVRKAANKFQGLILEEDLPVLSIPSEKLSPAIYLQTTNPFAKIYFSLRAKTVEILDKNHYFHKSSPIGKEAAVFLSRADVELIEAHVASAITKEAKMLEKNLFILSTVVSLAPFLGILGTVWGILISLSELQKGGMVQSNSIVLGGLSTALATTVLGLVIAIPALIAYNYLKSSHKSFYTEMEDFGNIVLSTIELQYRKVDN